MLACDDYTLYPDDDYAYQEKLPWYVQDGLRVIGETHNCNKCKVDNCLECPYQE